MELKMYTDNNGYEFAAGVLLPCPFCGFAPNVPSIADGGIENTNDY